MKPSKRNLLNVLVLGLLLAMTACGKKNKVTSDKLPGTTTVNQNTGYIPAGAANDLVNQLKSQNGCNRMPDMIFNTNTSVSNNVIAGPFNPTPLSGVVAGTYVGLSSFKDIMVVTKLVNNGQLMGYNVILSFCEYQPLIIPGRSFSNMQVAMPGITLTEMSNCAVGYATANNIRFDLAAFAQYQAGKVDTAFGYPASSLCNGGFGK